MLRKLLLLSVLAVDALAQKPVTVTLLHFSDYHSHALPFYTEAGERGGIARAIAYLKQEKRRGAIVFSGGDTINKGAPAWSDKFSCVEWPWWHGIVSAMAFGNHEPDYGLKEFERCRAQIAYPVLSANTEGFRPFTVIESRGVRIGVFAVAGTDFPELIKNPELHFSDPIPAARAAVRDLREKEHADVVVMIGHEHQEADYALAKAVPGIDIIFGSHSHLERELTRIPGTATWFISPSQYLTLISRLEVTVAGHQVTAVRGSLIPVDARMREDRTTAKRVRRLQRGLEQDPEYRQLFVPIATLDAALSTETLARLTLDTMRAATASDVALSTTSSFRGALPRGILTMELLRGVLPYDNEIVTCPMSGSQLQRVLDFSSDTFTTGVPPVDPAKTYRVATTDYLADLAYKDVFLCDKTKTGLRVRDEVRKRLAAAKDAD